MKIDIVRIMAILPHRYPFLLIDRVLELQINKLIIGIKNVTVNEPQFTGHFPVKPIMPGVLIVEAMAQLSAILIAESINVDQNRDFFLMSIEEAKFRQVVEPGDTMYIYAQIEQNRSSVWKLSSIVKVNDQLVAESKFTTIMKNRS